MQYRKPPILEALKRALDRGVDVQIVYHDTTSATGTPNETAMRAAGLPVNDQKITYRRSKPKIPHNKFIIRLKSGTDPVEVWTGSTNFTPSGFLGQTNVGHRVADRTNAKQYLDFWTLLKADPDIAKARAGTAKLTPDPAQVIAPSATARFFSPRVTAAMLDWYASRMLNAANSVWLTAAFGVTAKLVPAIAKARNQMRFVLMEKPASATVKKQLTKDLTHVILSYGIPLGGLYMMKKGQPVARKPIQQFELDKWYLKEELYRPKNEGFVFFVHTKFLLIDPLSDDPLVCSGSANFSPDSLLQNDENMLLIRGGTRVADIYMTEFDRVFRHFYFRDIANELASKGNNATAIFLDETDKWTDAYFTLGHIKNNRRLMFFDQSTATWFGNAAAKTPAKAKRAATPVRSRPRGKSVKTTTTARRGTSARAKHRVPTGRARR